MNEMAASVVGAGVTLSGMVVRACWQGSPPLLCLVSSFAVFCFTVCGTLSVLQVCTKTGGYLETQMTEAKGNMEELMKSMKLSA